MQKVIFLLSFFAYSGYYVGLAFLFAFKLSELSRLYSIPLRLFLALLMVWLIQKNFKGLVEKARNVWFLLFLLFWGLYFMKVMYTANVSAVFYTSKPWYEFIFFALTYVILPFLSFMAIDYHRYKQTILNGFIFSGFLLGLANLYIYGGALGSGIARVSELTYETGDEILSPLALSYSGSLTIVLCVYKLLMAKSNSTWVRLYLLATIVLAFIMFLLGSSRGSVIAIMLSIMVFLAYSPAKNKFQLMVLTALATPAVIWAIEASGSGVLSRFANVSKDGGGGRMTLWSNAFEHFLQYPLFGGRVEIGGFYPHNFILEILMATGVIGGILIFPLFLKTILKSRSLKGEDMFVFLIFIQGLCLHIFSGAVWSATLLFLPMGIILYYSKSDNYRTLV
jgi:hypothetical protein